MKKPRVGSWVRVTTSFADYRRTFARTRPTDTHTYVGKVMESQDWEREDSFALLTTDSKMRIKTIELSRVVSMETLKAVDVHAQTEGAFRATMREEKADDRTFEITGSKGNTYLVVKSKFNWTCNCVAGERGRRCKHVAEAQLKLKAETIGGSYGQYAC